MDGYDLFLDHRTIHPKMFKLRAFWQIAEPLTTRITAVEESKDNLVIIPDEEPRAKLVTN